MTPIASTPEGLAVLACDPTSPREQREGAVACLAELVREVAGQCAAALRADARLRLDLVEGSWEHVEARLPRYDPLRGQLVAWLRVVLTRLGHDLRRARQREARHLESLARRSAAGADAQEAAALLEASFRRMRADLDACAWPPAREVDHFAVLLVLLRVKVAAVCRRLWPLSPPGDVADRAAGAVPWRAVEEGRCFRQGLPSLGELWGRLAPRLDRAAGTPVVLEALNDPPPDAPVHYGALAQWAHRAQKMAQERLGEVAWRDHGFAQLLCHPGQEVL